MEWLKNCKNKKRKKKQTDCCVVENLSGEDCPNVCFGQNCTNDNHGQYNRTAADGSNGILQKRWQGDWQEHQEKSDKNIKDAGMFRQLFEGVFFIFRCDEGESCRRHGKAGGNLIV